MTRTKMAWMRIAVVLAVFVAVTSAEAEADRRRADIRNRARKPAAPASRSLEPERAAEAIAAAAKAAEKVHEAAAKAAAAESGKKHARVVRLKRRNRPHQPAPRYPRQQYPNYPSYPAYPPAPAYPPPQPRYPAPQPQYPPPPAYPVQPKYPVAPKYPPKYNEVCKLKEWSTDTELCVPSLAQSCEQMRASVFKIEKPKPRCIEITIPKCKTTNDAEEIELCTTKIITEDAELKADVFGQEMKKKCNTHYRTKCRPGYGGYNPEPVCTSVPMQLCYDSPVLKKKEIPIRIKLTRVESKCAKELIPTPSTKCWEETSEYCISVPKLKEKDEHLSKCAITVSEDECRKVRLTIPREFCYHVQSYGPQAYQSPHHG